jgi:hypothetical protein
MSSLALDMDLRHTIRLCWKTLRGQQAFKAVAIDTDLAAMLPDEFAPKLQITNTWACGSSASRLCELLVGEALENYITAPDAVKLSDTKAVAQAIAAMKQAEGCVLARINVLEGNAGHSYIFLSHLRDGTGPLLGTIYQTNVGCHKDSAFDLMAWINDPKSEKEVDLEEHLGSVQREMTPGASPAASYQKNYMLSTKQLTPAEVSGLNQPSKAASFVFMWRVVKMNDAVERLKALRAQYRGAVKWPSVKTPSGFRTGG